MKVLLRVVKWLLILVAVSFIGAQFYRPAKTNPAIDPSMTLEARMPPSPQVAQILDRSCKDCHSNETRWPWYSHVAPFSWFVIDHVNKGRVDLNMSEWARYEKAEAANQLRNMCREARSGVMPLESYTMIHRGAVMSQDDIKVLCDWANAEREKLAK
jgi:hypothetical protein